jgi:hypothetical protein
MRRNRRPVSTAATHHLDSFLNAYSIAAAAAGVSVLALATPAEGKVVITHANISIPQCNCPVYLDLSNNGVNDFSFRLSYSNFSTGYYLRFLNVKELEGGGVKGTPQDASCLVQGAKIGPSAQFASAALMESSFLRSNKSRGTYTRSLHGKWGENHPNRYLGVKFKIDGATHYGWIRVKVTSRKGYLAATITEYGYETVANKSLDAGLSTASADDQAEEVRQPVGASLGALALGADGLAIWRHLGNPSSETPASGLQ